MTAVSADPSYEELIQSAYGRAPNYGDLGRAIASFERTLIFLDAPFDRFIAGDAKRSKYGGRKQNPIDYFSLSHSRRLSGDISIAIRPTQGDCA